MSSSGGDPIWSWPEDRWRSLIESVRAGRSLKPRKWKNGARAAVAIAVHFDNEIGMLAAGMTTPARLSQGHYGARAGLGRVLGALKRHSVPATFFVPAVAAMLYGDELRTIAGAGHEIALAGWIGEVPAQLPPGVERDLITGARETIARLVGQAPTGYQAPGSGLSAETPAVLCDLGFIYESSLMSDDDPFDLTMAGQPTGLVSLPAAAERDDATYWGAGDTAGTTSPHAVFEILRRDLERAYDEGGLFQLTLHPALIGRRSRIWVLEELFGLARSLPGVWFATHHEIAHWCRSKA
ncbi:MAG TPA: polysaccharide deacetylase family protein [Beijerinckiaceae bacterium]|nr:polysaccharide deacetylase family protein [Beijerinckiaceae bacterium]